MTGHIATILKKNNLARQVYRILKRIDFTHSIPQIAPITVKKSRFDFRRINLVVPSINEEHFFGGVSTALTLLDEIIKKTNSNIKSRLILTDAIPDKKDMEKFFNYKLVSFDQDIDVDHQMLPVRDKYQKNIFITKNDRFIATAWWTAYITQNILRNQAELYDQAYKTMGYMIQDFEPGFYNWSAHFTLADSTYKSDIPTIAIFNSSLLRDFFKNKAYRFEKEYFFEPNLNSHLKQYLHKIKGPRKKNILIYGRPSVERNCFPLLVAALKEWVWKQPGIGEWKLLSIGERHKPINLGNGVTLVSLGKLTLSDYAKLLLESAIGLSFMISPHPSYPPLEMAHFGLLTLTNSYANKNLSQYHDNIFSLEKLTPPMISNGLINMTKKFSDNPTTGIIGKSHVPYYCQDLPQFPFLHEFTEFFLH